MSKIYLFHFFFNTLTRKCFKSDIVIRHCLLQAWLHLLPLDINQNSLLENISSLASVLIGVVKCPTSNVCLPDPLYQVENTEENRYYLLLHMPLLNPGSLPSLVLEARRANKTQSLLSRNLMWGKRETENRWGCLVYEQIGRWKFGYEPGNIWELIILKIYTAPAMGHLNNGFTYSRSLGPYNNSVSYYHFHLIDGETEARKGE